MFRLLVRLAVIIAVSKLLKPLLLPPGTTLGTSSGVNLWSLCKCESLDTQIFMGLFSLHKTHFY